MPLKGWVFEQDSYHIYAVVEMTEQWSSFKSKIKVTVYLWGCLASKRYSAVGINCRQLKPYIKLKLIELAFNL